MTGSDSGSIEPTPAAQPTDWFDIDAFLDDYVNDLGNQDPLDQINLDFSLPFPQSKPAEPHLHLPPAPMPAVVKTQQEETMPEPTSESEQPSEPDEAPARPQRTNTRGRGASKAKSEKSEPRNAAQQRKHLALQEKNRRAQRRFRERQKMRVVELEEQVAALTAQLTATTMERDSLVQRNLELEAASVSAGNNNNGSGESPRIIISRPMFPPTSEACSDAGHSLSAACSQGLTLTPKVGGPEIALSPADLCNMTQPVLSNHFSMLVKECAKTYVEGAGTPEVDERVCQLVDQALTLWQRVAQCNAAAAKQFATCKVDESGRGQPADERAPYIVRSLVLTDRQKTELCNLRRLFLQRVSSIVSVRSSAAGQGLGGSVPFGGTSGRALASHQLAARQAARQVSTSLQEEHSAAVEFETMVTRHVLSPAQSAQLLIQSYPWPPDCLALATWVAAESAEADALAALSAEAQARAASAAAAVAGKAVGHGALHNPIKASAAAAAACKAVPAAMIPSSGVTQSPFIMTNALNGGASGSFNADPTSSVNTGLPMVAHSYR